MFTALGHAASMKMLSSRELYLFETNTYQKCSWRACWIHHVLPNTFGSAVRYIRLFLLGLVSEAYLISCRCVFPTRLMRMFFKFLISELITINIPRRMALWQPPGVYEHQNFYVFVGFWYHRPCHRSLPIVLLVLYQCSEGTRPKRFVRNYYLFTANHQYANPDSFVQDSSYHQVLPRIPYGVIWRIYRLELCNTEFTRSGLRNTVLLIPRSNLTS